MYKLSPYVFGYFSKTETWEDVKHIPWVSEFIDVLQRHEPTRRFLQSTNLSAQTLHRFTNTQLQPQKRFASQTRMQTDKHTHLPYSTLDWQTPFGICRFIEEIRSVQVPRVFVKYAPRHDTLRQRVAEVMLGRTKFEELIVGRKWNDAAHILFVQTCSRDSVEHVTRLVNELTELGTWPYPSSVHELEQTIFSNRKRTTLELLHEIRDISHELKSFLKHGTLDVSKVESRLTRMDKIISIGSSTNLAELSSEEFQNVFRVQQTHQPSPDPSDTNLKEECTRLERLLEQHKIDYVQVPNKSLEELQTFISVQLERQRVLARTFFDESSSNAEKFDAENQLDAIQKKVETAKRKQFAFEPFLHERLQVLESVRPFAEQVRTKLVDRYKDVSPDTPFVKLPFKTRRLFPDSEIGAYVSKSNTHFRSWLAAVRADTSVDYLKYPDIRTSLCVLFESCKWVPCLLFLFHLGTDAWTRYDDLKTSVHAFLLQLDTNVHERKSGFSSL